MWKAILVLLSQMALYATSVTVVGTTPQQIVLRIVPDTTSCTFTISPPVYDADPTVFANANQCARETSIVNGSEITLVIGRRAAAWNLTGTHRVSRSLAANTFYTITVISGPTPVVVTASTKTIPTGNTWTDPLPSDPDHPGQYLLPEFQDPTNRAETINDVSTGAVIHRVSLPQDLTFQPTSGIYPAWDSAWPLDSGWVANCPLGSTTGIQCGALNKTYDSIHAATYTGTGSGTPGWLFLRIDSAQFGWGANEPHWSAPAASIDWFQVGLTAGINKVGCGSSGLNDCKVQVALTIDGVNPGTNIIDVEIPTTIGALPTIGNQVPDMSFWRAPFTEPWTRPEVSTPTGTASVAANGTTVTWVTGDNFRTRWVAGSWLHFTDASSHVADCQVSALTASNGNEVSLVSNTCLSGAGFTIPTVANINWTAPNFGLLIRKKTNTVNTVSIGASSYAYGSSNEPTFAGDGAFLACGTAYSAGGTYCTMNGSTMYWVTQAGSVTFIGAGSVPTRTGAADNWNRIQISQGGNSLNIDSSNNIYALITDSNGKLALVRGTINDPAHTASPRLNGNTGNALGTSCNMTFSTYTMSCTLNGIANAIQWTILTPGSLSQDLTSQLVSFTAGQAYSVNPAIWTLTPTQCYMGGFLDLANTKIGGWCRNAQDMPGWYFVINLGDGNPANAGGTGPSIVAVTSSFANFPCRYCKSHQIVNPYPANGWIELSMNTGAATTGGWQYTLTDASIGNSTVGAPRTLHFSSTTPSTMSSNASYIATPLAVGDYVSLTTSATGFAPGAAEIDQVIAIVGTTVTTTVISAPAALSGTIYAWGQCANWNAQNGNFVGLWWDWQNDPHGLNAGWQGPSGTDPRSSNPLASTIVMSPAVLQSHQSYSNSYFIAAATAPWITVSNGYEVINQLPTALFSSAVPHPNALTISTSGSFAAAPPACSIPNSCQSHNSYIPTSLPSTSPAATLDVYPLFGAIQPGSWTNVSGSLWKITSTVGATPDDLSGNVIINRKRQPTAMAMGRRPGLDISGPTSSITSGSTDRYKYCIARVINECFSGSSVGDIYINHPFIFYLGFTGASGSAVCTTNPHSMYEGNNYRNMPCTANSSPGLNGIYHFRVDRNDPTGAYGRTVSNGLSRWLAGYEFGNAQPSPDASWAIFDTYYASNGRGEGMLVDLPSIQADDSVQRNVFVPVTVNLSGPSGTSTAWVKFGYLEYGAQTKAYCTSRQEACVANTATVNQLAPFQFVTTDSPTKLTCGSGCSIAIPKIPNRVAYWWPEYFDGGGNMIGGGPSYIQVAHTP